MNPTARSLASSASRAVHGRRYLHASRARRAITNMQMPAMSPTMKEGGIANWKVKEGATFAAGDVLLEIETDKATIDVEAQDDGILGKIIINDGAKNVPVGKVIAILAEEGDDISNLEVPKEDEASSSSASSSTSSSAPPAPEAQSESSSPPPAAHHGEANLSHARPLFPSVLRLLQEHGADASKITGTGIRGMLTKGDVLAFLGKASGPTGSFKVDNKVKDGPAPTAGGKAPAKEAPKAPLDGLAIRQLIVNNLLNASKIQAATPSAVDFDSIIDDYLPRKPSVPKSAAPLPPPKAPSSDFLAGLL